MFAIELRFPTGKFHATPWGRQVNEGAVEWPPSPWRLLRAILAVWHYKFPDVPTDEMQSLFSLLSENPVYHLPPASTGHTRHFMPGASIADRPKIFDTFVALSPDSPIVVIWPHLELSTPQRSLLKELLSAMSYFGRAESWVDAGIADQWDGDPNAFPLEERDVSSKEELVRLLAPSEELSFQNWREEALGMMASKALSEKQEKARQKGKTIDKEMLTPKEQQSLQNSLPTSVFDAIHVETSAVRAAGWNYPPGSHWVNYVRPQNAFTPSSRIRHEEKKMLPRVARFAIASNVRPLFTEAVLIGDRVRTAVMSKSRQLEQARNLEGTEIIHAAPIFSGKNEGGMRIDGHCHAHFLPESVQGDRRIRYLTVFAEQGFSAQDEMALSALQKVWGDGGHDLQLVLLGTGQPSDFGGTNEKLGQSPILSRSQNWISYTPLIPTDHLKIRNSERRDPLRSAAAKKRELESLVRKELSRRAWLRRYADTVQVDVMLDTDSLLYWRKFRRSRDKGGGQRSLTTGYGFRIRFPEPVQGPISLGYGCHFGLGQFIPEGTR